MKEVSQTKNTKIALVLDGFINGLGIVRSLKKAKGITVAILCKKGAALAYSNHVDYIYYYDNDKEFEEQLFLINTSFTQVIPYYCKDNHLKKVFSLKEKLSNFKIFHFDLNLLEKNAQMLLCEKTNVRYPKSYFVSNEKEFDALAFEDITYIIKPVSSSKENPFKTKITSDIVLLKKYTMQCIALNIKAIISNYIPGDDRSLITLGGYSNNGMLEMSFCGRKIAQRPKNNGVASVAESINDTEIIEIGKKFLSVTTFTGIFQIEFKLSPDNTYYFIEFNPRNWSWGYVSTIVGKNLALKKYNTETNNHIKDTTIAVPNFYLWTEGVFYNLFKDKWLGGITRALKLLCTKKVTFAIFSWNDPKPFFKYLLNLILFAFKLRKEIR
ncbi:hypothetical protein N9766_05655 [Flavobacteriaceae bacterium]|nr:hypothetical protein [Flavobacteriaceae bacterium]